MKRYFYFFYIIILIFFFTSEINLTQDRAENKKPSPQVFTEKNNKTKVEKADDSGEAEFKSRSSEKRRYNEKSNEYSINYFRIDKSGKTLWDGKHWDLNDFPLKVYIKKSHSKHFKPRYRKYIEYAFEIWSLADPRIEFIETNSAYSADLVISFEENLMKKYEENFLGLTDYKVNKRNKIEKSIIEIGLLKYNDEPISEGEVKATIIHEIGHALGLGHSDNDYDLMYPLIDPDTSPDFNYNELSIGDIEAVKSVIDLGRKIRYTIR